MESNKIYVGCTMVILNPSRDKVLIGKRKTEPDSNGWQTPGGTVDYQKGETARDAVRREIFEETGLQISDPIFLCLINSFYYGPERPISIAFVGCVDTDSIPPNPEPEKSEDWHWVDLKNIPEGKWFRKSRIAIDFYNMLQQNPTADRFVIDHEYEKYTAGQDFQRK